MTVVNLENLPEVREDTAIYLKYWREWLDEVKPEHHIYDTKHQGDRRRLKLYVAQGKHIILQKIFSYANDEQRAEVLGHLLRLRNGLPDYAFCNKRLCLDRFELPGVDINTADSWVVRHNGKTRCFPPGEYKTAIKHLFDLLGVPYPYELFNRFQPRGLW